MIGKHEEPAKPTLMLHGPVGGGHCMHVESYNRTVCSALNVTLSLEMDTFHTYQACVDMGPSGDVGN